jgi:hypothetical protein
MVKLKRKKRKKKNLETLDYRTVGQKEVLIAKRCDKDGWKYVRGYSDF